MLRSAMLSAVLAITLGGSLVLGQDVSGSVAETITARRGLMNQLASIQALIDARLAASDYSVELYELGQAAAESLDAFALLLPENSNLLGGMPAVEGADTTAAAAIWDDLPAFQKLLRDTADQARLASDAADLAAFSASWSKVAESCASCHQTYVVYDPFAGLN